MLEAEIGMQAQTLATMLRTDEQVTSALRGMNLRALS